MATNVGEAVIKLTYDTSDLSQLSSKVSKTIDSSISSTEKKTSKLSTTLATAGATLVSTAVQSVTSTISSALDDAISRVDTLNAFPKVMENLGFSAEEASSVINDLSDKLTGLPTKLDDATSSVQRLVAKNGDLTKSKDLYLAVNDAILAGTNDVQKQSSAMEQLLQAYSRGKMSMQDWKILLEAMPGQLNQVATSMGMSLDELAFALGVDNPDSPTVSMETFFEQIQKLDSEGVDGFASFSEQAKTSTQGIGTSIENVKTAITRAIANIIDTIGQDRINSILQGIIQVINGITPVISGVVNFLIDHKEVVIAALGAIGTVLVGTFAVNKVKQGIEGIKNLVSGISTTFSSVASKISGSGNKISKSIEGIGTKGKAGITKAKNTLSGSITSALTGLKNILVSAVQVVTEPLKALLKGVAEALASFFTALANPQIAVGAAMFAVAAAAVAAAILLIGSAIGVVTPSIAEFMNTVIIPLASFIATTLLTALNVITDCIIRLSNEALIPVGEFLRDTFVIVVESVNNAIISLTQNAIVPLVETISGAFIGILNSVSGVLESVGNVINNIVKTALEGIQGTITAVGTAFESMGNGIKAALDGVSGVLSSFKDIIMAIGNAIIATVALATGRSVNYGTGYAHVFAEGGRVIGPGTGTSDSIPAMLSNGEYIIKAESAKSIGYDALDKLNATGDFETSPLTKVVMNSGEESGAGEGVVVNMNVYVNNEMDASDIGRKLEESIRRYV